VDLRGRKWREAGEDYVMRSFITLTLYASPNFIRVIKLRGMRLGGHVACMVK
jgi:hypothetical protein